MTINNHSIISNHTTNHKCMLPVQWTCTCMYSIILYIVHNQYYLHMTSEHWKPIYQS